MCQRLAGMPRKGVLRPEFGKGIHTFPLWKRIVIVYELSADTMTVLRVFSAGRDYEAIMRGDWALTLH
jgi:toxin ParE1/3/4